MLVSKRQHTSGTYRRWSLSPNLVATLAIFAVLLTNRAPSQVVPCFNSEDAPPWIEGDLALTAPGASRPVMVLGADGFELCSQGGGFGGTEDGFRFLEQSVWDDFELTARLEKIDAVGLSRLIATVDGRDEDAAHVRIIVRPASTGGHEVHSSYRLNEGDPAEPETSTPASLPVTLRITRSGNRFITSYAADEAFVDDLDFTVAADDLDVQRLRTGMVSASEDDLTSATACFTRVVLQSTPGKPPGLGCLEAFVIPMEDGTELKIVGSSLGNTSAVTLAGVPATILENTSQLLRVRAGPLDATGTARPLAGDVIVTTREGSALLRNAVTYAGRLFLRGNVNDDEDTDLSDAIFLLAYLFSGGRAPTCLQAGEINGDLAIDLSDAIFLLQHLCLGGRRPAPPFGTEGVSLTGEVYGLPEAPPLSALTHPDGSPVTPSDTLAENDVVILVGQNLPVQREIIVLFGETRAEVLASSTDSDLHVRILSVPTGGRKCPRHMEVWGDTRLPDDRDGTYINSLGHRSGIIAEVDFPDECPQFQPSQVDVVATSRFDETGSAWSWSSTDALDSGGHGADQRRVLLARLASRVPGQSPREFRILASRLADPANVRGVAGTACTPSPTRAQRWCPAR